MSWDGIQRCSRELARSKGDQLDQRELERPCWMPEVLVRPQFARVFPLGRSGIESFWGRFVSLLLFHR
jgi:hypothetical protein